MADQFPSPPIHADQHTVEVQRWELSDGGQYALANRPIRLHGLGRINVLLGKNGSGKSQVMRGLHSQYKGTKRRSHYITPERGGKIAPDINLLINTRSNVGWADTQRVANQWTQYKNETVDLFDELRNSFYREVHNDNKLRSDNTYTFESAILQNLNDAIPNVDIVPTDKGFELSDKKGNTVSADSISSGESEMIALCVDLLNFSIRNRNNSATILIDEPDVHLHPDLQDSLAKYICSLSNDYGIDIFVSTHSTALLHAFHISGQAKVAFMSRESNELRFRHVSEVLESILPIFGAHPLSSSFNKMPLLICEGEDDVRIWSRAVRSSGGRIAVLPRAAGGAGEIPKFEAEAVEIMAAVYDHPVAFSLFDGDQTSPDYPAPPVKGGLKRMYLQCRDAENLLLTDEVISSSGTTWADLSTSFGDWIKNNPSHRYHEDFLAFQKTGYDRINGDVKTIRNIILSFLSSNAPWEEIVGGQIAKISSKSKSPTSLSSFLGDEVVSSVLGIAS